MRRCLITAVLIIFQFAPGLIAGEFSPGVDSPPEAPYREHEEKEFRFYPGGTITVSATAPGTLRIVGWRHGSVRMEAEKIVHDLPPEKAAALLETCPVRVRHGETSAAVMAEYPSEPPAMLEINITLFVPGDRTDIVIRKRHGDVFVDSINGWVEMDIGEGSLDARSMAGYFSAKIRQGNIMAEMSGIRWRGMEFAAMTQQGSVELTLPADYSAALQLETRNGVVFVDYPPRMVEGEPVPPSIISRKKGELLRASVGEGGTPVKLGTSSGNVLLSLKE